MDYGEQTTGTRDEHYNLVSVLYHALHGAENCDRYAADAEVTGDERLADFFREAQAMQAQLAERAKELLGILESPPEFGATLGNVLPGAEVSPGVPTGDLPPRAGPELPPESDPLAGTAPEDVPEDVRRGTTPDAPLAPPEEAVPPDVASPPEGERAPREEPPPGEERPERRGEAPTTPPTTREEPPAGEERPGRRTP
jgi:hypothetical protein